jgi:hypothetical protein
MVKAFILYPELRENVTVLHFMKMTERLGSNLQVGYFHLLVE